MELNEYQKLAMKTLKHWDNPNDQARDAALGLTGEAGEVADLLKKHFLGTKPLDIENLKKELGDVLWYIAEMSETYGFSLNEVAQTNIEKLKKRHGESFSGYGKREEE